MVKDALSTPELVRELLGLVKRYGAVQSICRAAIAPLGFLVTDGTLQSYPARFPASNARVSRCEHRRQPT